MHVCEYIYIYMYTYTYIYIKLVYYTCIFIYTHHIVFFGLLFEKNCYRWDVISTKCKQTSIKRYVMFLVFYLQDLLLKMHCPCHGTMVNSTVRGISGPFHDPLTGQTSDACCWKWKQWRSHRSRSMAC